MPRLAKSSVLIRVYVTDFAAILETYSLSELFELNDLTEEEVLDHLVTQGFLHLPEITPLEFE